MDLKYFNAKTPFNKTPKEAYNNDLINIFNSSIENAPNYFTDIEVEKEYGTKKFVRTAARVDSVINPSTGYKYGDDFKSFIFSPTDSHTFIGRLIKWHGSYWLAINANTHETILNGCIFRRCNNFLRWIDENGNKILEPCIIDYNIMESGDYAGRDLTTVGGFEKIWCQRNSRTIYIKPNQRFLFGNPVTPICYKVYGDGVRNFLNSFTADNNSPSLIELTVGGNYSNKDTDDFENLIADAYKNKYSITINQENISQLIGFKTQLTTEVKKNNEIIEGKSVIWRSDDKKVCSVDEDGNIECLSLGSCNITAYLYDNPDIKYSINISVSEAIEEKYIIEVVAEDYQYDDSILQGDTVTYKCLLYKNAVLQESSFNFELSTKAKYLDYDFAVIDKNHFKVTNKKKSSEKLKVICTTENGTYEHIISLKGAW